MNLAEPLRVIVCRGAFPNNFVAEILKSKYRIYNNLQVMTRGRVAVQVEAAGRFQDAVQLDQTGGHHDEVSHHLVASDEVEQGADGFGDFVRRVQDQGFVSGFGCFAPVPGVFKGGDLGFAVGAAFGFEEHIVVAVAVEGRVEVYEVDAAIGEVVSAAQDVEVVAVEESVAHGVARCGVGCGWVGRV